MSLIGTEVKPFTAQAYHNGKFVEITEANLIGGINHVTNWNRSKTVYSSSLS